MIDERGRCGSHRGHGKQRPVAAFDWDNTVVKNDITDATIAWSLHHDKILRPASWKSTSKWMTDAADQALTKACGTKVPVGKPLPTSTDTDCADEIFEVREDGKTMSGAAAFAGEWDHRHTVPQYAWVPQLFAGHTVARTGVVRREGPQAGPRRPRRRHPEGRHARDPRLRPLLRAAARPDPHAQEGRVRRLHRLRGLGTGDRGLVQGRRHRPQAHHRHPLDPRPQGPDHHLEPGLRRRTGRTRARPSPTSTASAAGSTRRSTASRASRPGTSRTGPTASPSAAVTPTRT